MLSDQLSTRFRNAHGNVKTTTTRCSMNFNQALLWEDFTTQSTCGNIQSHFFSFLETGAGGMTSRNWGSASCTAQASRIPGPNVNSASSHPKCSLIPVSSPPPAELHRAECSGKSFFTRYLESSRKDNHTLKQLPLNETGWQPWWQALK